MEVWKIVFHSILEIFHSIPFWHLPYSIPKFSIHSISSSIPFHSTPCPMCGKKIFRRHAKIYADRRLETTSLDNTSCLSLKAATTARLFLYNEVLQAGLLSLLLSLIMLILLKGVDSTQIHSW